MKRIGSLAVAIVAVIASVFVIAYGTGAFTSSEKQVINALRERIVALENGRVARDGPVAYVI